MLKSIVTYSSEIWQFKDNTETLSSVTEVGFWRRSDGAMSCQSGYKQISNACQEKSARECTQEDEYVQYPYTYIHFTVQ